MDQTLIDKHRYDMVEYDDWYEYVYESFIDDCRGAGIEVEWSRHGNNKKPIASIYFRLSYSQGDGACFSGYSRSKDLIKCIDAHSLGAYPMVRKLVDEGGYIKVYWGCNGHYMRSNNVAIENDLFVHFLGEDHPLAEIWDEELDKEVIHLEQDMDRLVADYSRKLYRSLREEFEYLTSDETVWEYIQANDLIEEVHHE